MNKEEFLEDSISNYDLVMVKVVGSSNSQILKARVEKIYSSSRGVCSDDSDIEFVHAPETWGCVALTDKDRALLFVRNISGKLYEAAWNGHFLLESINGQEYAIYRAKELWDDKSLPEEIRTASIQDPRRDYATAIGFKQLERYLQKLIKYSG